MIRFRMARKTVRRKVGQVPAPRSAVKLPPAHTPTPHIAATPIEHGAKKPPNPAPPNPAPPNPVRPRLVRDTHGGVLKDLFFLLPELPSPPRPPSRKSAAFRYPSSRRRT